MKPVCLASILLVVVVSGCHSPWHGATCGSHNSLWDNFCSGDGCGGLFGAGLLGCGSSEGKCECSQGCGSGYGTPCGGSCGGGTCGTEPMCPNCGVVGAMCASGCRACGAGLSSGPTIRPSIISQARALAGGQRVAIAGTGGHPGMAGGVVRLPARAAANVVHNAHRRCANGLCGGGAVGPEYGAVTYPYYTTRGPRDFLLANPASIGP